MATHSLSLLQRRASRRRKLHVGHFAFMRAVVQGLSVREVWDRYLRIEGEHTDLRAVRSTIAWIRDEFSAAARSEARHGTARLVLIDAASLREPSPHLPNLAEFAQEQGLEDFSQAEQIEAFEGIYGKATQKQARRARFIARQLDALRWLQSLIAEPPGGRDAVASWLNPVLARHFAAADIFTLAQLVERINGVGFRWNSSIKAVGPVKALRIVEWLRDHEASLELTIGAHVAQPRSEVGSAQLNAVVALATDVRPIEKFIVPGDLDGSRGRYRRPQADCLLAASTDYEAILAWINSKHGPAGAVPASAGIREAALSNTQRSYRKEAERFLLWAIIQKGKALSSMTQEDCVEYRQFLADPQPRTRWCGDRGRQRWSPLWRPFEGPLASSAQRQAITILRGLYSFLVDQNYLMGNPWSGVTIPRSPTPRMDVGRSFTRAQWAFAEQRLDRLPLTSASLRLQVAVRLLYASGLRLVELISALASDLRWVEYPADADDAEALQGWMLRVVGKGQRMREVPLPASLVGEVSRYFVSRGLPADLQSLDNDGAFLLGKASDRDARAPGLVSIHASTDPKSGIEASTLYEQLKTFFSKCAVELRHTGDHRSAQRFDKASTHWIRHSHASHSIASGTPIEVAQQNLGHASLATTTLYVTTESKRRMKAMQGFWELRSR